MSMLVRKLRQWAKTAAGWSPEERDAVLYSASALFAGLTTLWSSIPLYQQWGKLAVGPYALGAVVSAWMAHRHRSVDQRDLLDEKAGASRLSAVRQTGSASPSDVVEAGGRGRQPVADPMESGSSSGAMRSSQDGRAHWTGARVAVFLVVLCGATLMPLSLEVLWQANSGGLSHAQPEVAVVEQAGGRILHGKGLYQQVSAKGTKPSVPRGEPAYETYFPYLPGMAVFGLPSGTGAPQRLTDARVLFSLITILVVIAALAMCRGPAGGRVLTLQVMTVLPTAALPLATGGDDLPVVALMLLGLVLLQRRRPFSGGLALGAAASLKFTAWPLAALALFVARDAKGHRAIGRLLAGMGVLALPAVLPVMLRNPRAFFDNVVKFPLGLTGIHSPAASALPGHLLVTALPALHRPYTIVLALVGCVVIGRLLMKHPPRTPGDAAWFMAWASLAAILLAPATRVGYLLYPLDMLAWTWLLRGEEAVLGLGPDHSEAGTSNTSRVKAVVPADRELVPEASDAPEPALAPGPGVTEKAVGATVTPTSQYDPSLPGILPTTS